MDDKIKILMLEDDPNDRDMILYHLKKGGLKFISELVQTEEDFIQTLRSFVPDIILSDFSLPSFNGVNAFYLKQQISPDTPFIIVSGTIGEEKAVELIKTGVTDFVVKERAYSLPPKILRAIREAKDRVEKLAMYDELGRSERRLAKAQEVAHIGSWEFQFGSDQITWSDEACRIYGIQPGKNLYSVKSLLSFVHPNDRHLVVQRVREAQQGFQDIAIHHRIITARGEVKSIYAESKFEFDADGVATGWYGIVYDITKMKMAEEEILKLNAELEERVKQRTSELEIAVKQLESFSSTVSHDLRSPLQVINGYASILNRKYKDSLDAEGQSLLDGIKENTRQMGQLIDDLLNFSKLGRTEPVKKPLDMNELVQAVIGQLRLSNDKLAARFRFHELKPCSGDKGLIYQVWVNLISNAVKYSRNEINPVIEIGTTKIDKEDVYYVKDNGVGFDMKHYDKLFRVFQRLHKPSDFEGTGVGLALVHAIITKHGGKVWAEGKLYGGAAFYFTLPGMPSEKSKLPLTALSII